MPTCIVLEARIMGIVTTANHVVSDLASENNLNGQSKTLKSLITAFEAELLSLIEGTESDGMTYVSMLNARALLTYLKAL